MYVCSKIDTEREGDKHRERDRERESVCVCLCMCACVFVYGKFAEAIYAEDGEFEVLQEPEEGPKLDRSR